IAVYGTDDTALNKIENEIRGILDSRLIYLKPATFKQEEGMASIIPTA
ncbi:hypothetical protein GW879_01120, partial [Candidatus Kaiserbacteria bacterium]|nr:hypothetical protein [Candidatus Kaiserbacteria bacterium]